MCRYIFWISYYYNARATTILPLHVNLINVVYQLDAAAELAAIHNIYRASSEVYR